MRIAVTGSIAYDYLMHFPGRFAEHILPDQIGSLSLSFLVDSMQRLRGGVAANIAYTMRLLGGEPIILATVGQDFGDYRSWLEEHGISTAQVVEIPNEFTASFFVSTDQDQNQIANFYTGAMAHARYYSLRDRQLTDVSAVIISPNDPTAMLNYAQECRLLGIPYIYDPSQQTARLSGEELRLSIPGAAFLMVNQYELALIEKKSGWDRQKLLEQVQTLVVTAGDQGSTIFTHDSTLAIPVAPPRQVAEPTGAGDAYRGGFLAAYGVGLPLEVCGRVGALCSTYVLEQIGTTSHYFTLAEFIARYQTHFGPEPGLRRLLQAAQAQVSS